MCIRQALKVSPKELPDRDIDIFVKALDDDGSGDLDIEELADFVERGVATFGAGPLDEEERTALRWGERDEAGGREERARLKEEAEKRAAANRATNPKNFDEFFRIWPHWFFPIYIVITSFMEPI